MFKKFIYLICLTLLTNCSAPGTALLGPIFTGAKTGSVYQASLSYGTSKIMNEVKQSDIFFKSEPISLNQFYEGQEPVIILSYAVENIEISDVLEPEHLP